MSRRERRPCASRNVHFGFPKIATWALTNARRSLTFRAHRRWSSAFKRPEGLMTPPHVVWRREESLCCPLMVFRRTALSIPQRAGWHCHAASGLRSHCWPDSQAHAENQLQRVSFPARDHSASNLALPPVHSQPAGRRGFVGGTRSPGVLRDGSALGEPFRTDDCGRPAQASSETPYDLCGRRSESALIRRRAESWHKFCRKLLPARVRSD